MSSVPLPGSISATFSLQPGFNWIGPFASRENDTLGMAVAYLGISPAKRRYLNEVVYFTGQGTPWLGNETVVEATWQIALTPWWMLQPDLQIVVNPGAGMPSAPQTTEARPSSGDCAR